MQKILSAEEMREVDRLTTEKYGIPSIILMENAAHAAARVITEKLGGSVRGKSFLILCGKGNNGGDGAALARILWQQDADVFVIVLGKIIETKGDAGINFRFLVNLIKHDELFIDFWEIESYKGFYDLMNSNIKKFPIDLIVDAVFGTGLTRKLADHYQQIVHGINQYIVHQKKIPIASLDLPSGLNADLPGLIGTNVKADFTITFTAPKPANVFPPASNFNGELYVANIGSPQELIDNSPSKTFVSENEDARSWLEKTDLKPDSYKKTRGTALIVAGSKNYSGAAGLAANACFAAGAGMVTLAAPESVRETVAMKVSDEIITLGLAETENGAFAKSAADEVLSKKTDVVAIGCGLSNEEKTIGEFVREIVEKRKTPLVLDADGLNALAPFDLQGSDELPLVLTPHIGEFRRLAGTADEIENRIETAREFAIKHQVILVLKGERSLIAEPGGRVVINPTGNAGISRAGAGDTLTGIITGFLAQRYGTEQPNLENTFETVVAALYISGVAGDIAAEKFGQRLMTATDIRNSLGEAIERIKK